MKGPKRKNRSPRWISFLLGVLLMLILLAAGGYVYSRYARVNGQTYRTDEESLDLRDQGLEEVDFLTRFKNLKEADLRGNQVPLEECVRIARQLPECTVLYDVPLGGEIYESTTTELQLPDLPQDWENILCFLSLRSLRVERCSDPAAMETLREQLPACAMSWSLGLGGDWFPAESTTLTVTSPAVYYQELLSQLNWFRALKRVELTPAVLTPEQQRSLLSAYPGIEFSWPVALGTAWVPSDTLSLSYAQTGLASAGELEGVLDLLPALEDVDFSGSGVPSAERLAFRDAHEELNVGWSVPIGQSTYPYDTQALDFNGVAMASTEELESVLPYLPFLKQVEMCDCGISNEDMDALGQRWPDIRFVWNVRFAGFTLRTDITYFCGSMDGLNHPYLTDNDTQVFKYLVDMEAMDLGHMNISDLSFLQYMPKLKYLIIAECYNIYDFTPLGLCKELVYLEAFHTRISDLTPLLNCTKIEDLNLCYTGIPQRNAWECLSQMETLERLWWCNCPLSDHQRAELQKLLPDCIFFLIYGGEPSGGQWRYHENYYEMRDALHMYYMPGGTNGVDDEGAQIVVDDHGREFHLKNFDGNPYWWTEPQYAGLGMPYIIGVTA